MVLSQLYERKNAVLFPKWVELLLIIILLLTLVIYPFVDAKFRNAPLYWAVLMPLLIVFAQEKGWVSRFLKSDFMQFLGSLTMSLFITHQMLIGILLRRLPEMHAMLMLALCLFIILTISWGMQIIFSQLSRFHNDKIIK